MKSLLAVSLALVLPFTATANLWACGAPRSPENSTQGKPAKPAEPAARLPLAPQPVTDSDHHVWVNPAWVGKKVVVYLRDGTMYEGKLVDLTDDSLRLKVDEETKEVPLAEVGSVEKQQGRGPWPAIAIAGLAIGAVAVGVLIAAAQD